MERRIFNVLKEISSFSFSLVHKDADINRLLKIISLITTANEVLFFLVEDGHLVNIKENKAIEIKESLLKEVIESKKGRIFPLAFKHQKFNPEVDNIYNFDVKHLMVIPVIREGSVIGIIEAFVTDKTYHQFIEDDLKFLESLNELFVAFVDVLTGKVSAKEILFFKEIIHDIKNIINGIYSVLSFLKLENQNKTLSKYIDLALQSSKLVSDLSYLLMNLGRDEVVIREVNLIKELEPLLFLFCNNAEKKGIHFYTLIDIYSNAIVEVDILKIKQILLNLVMNAIKFTQKGYVEVSIDLKDENVVFKVKDTGIGIESDKIDALFAPFVQEDRDIKSRFGGTGLGLHIVKKYVESLGGKIEVKSEKGKGSEFAVTIPVKIKEFIPIEEYEVAVIADKTDSEFTKFVERFLKYLGMKVDVFDEEPLIKDDYDFAFYIDKDYSKKIARRRVYIYKEKFSSKEYDYELSDCLVRSGFIVAIMEDYEELEEIIDFDGKSVLIVEDNKLNRELLEILLKKLGIDVYVATNGLEGLDIVKKQKVDLIISDLEMPKIDGREFASKVKKMYPDIPIIAFTAMKEKDVKELIKKYDFDDYLLKPILLDRLITLLDEYLSK